MRELSGFEHILPTHQGRAAERILFTTLLEPGQITASNTHFDTTSANIGLVGGEARDFPSRDTGPAVPFAGNIGGVLAMADGRPAGACRELLVATEGFSTYGGLAGHDLEVLARGLEEVTDPAYLQYREQMAAWFADRAGAGRAARGVRRRRAVAPHIPPPARVSHRDRETVTSPALLRHARPGGRGLAAQPRRPARSCVR